MARAACLLGVVALASCWSGARPRGSRPVVSAAGDEIVVAEAPVADALAVDEHHVYWLGGSDEQAGLWRAEKRPGATAVRLAAAELPGGLALDDSHVYWGNLTEISAMPKTGGEARVIARIPRKLFVDDFVLYPDRVVALTIDYDRDQTLVWQFARSAVTEPKAIRSSAQAIRSSAQAITLEGELEAVAGHARGVHVATSRGLFLVDRDGFAKTMVSEDVTALAVDRQHVYFSIRDRDPQVLRLPGSRAAPDVPKRLDSAKGLVTAMASGPKFVYWGTHPDDEGARAIYRIAKRGGWRERVAPIREPGAFAFDATHVYWSDTGRGRIVRRPLDRDASVNR